MTPTTLPATYTRLTLAQRPKTHIDASTFRIDKSVPLPRAQDLKDDEALVQVDYLSMEPAMRGWLNDVPSYLPPGAYKYHIHSDGGCESSLIFVFLFYFIYSHN